MAVKIRSGAAFGLKSNINLDRSLEDCKCDACKREKYAKYTAKVYCTANSPDLVGDN